MPEKESTTVAQQQQQQPNASGFGTNGNLKDAAATAPRTEAPLWDYDWMDTGPLDNFLSDPTTIDWVRLKPQTPLSPLWPRDFKLTWPRPVE